MLGNCFSGMLSADLMPCKWPAAPEGCSRQLSEARAPANPTDAPARIDQLSCAELRWMLSLHGVTRALISQGHES